jgi:transcriptional regulatory protein LevR
MEIKLQIKNRIFSISIGHNTAWFAQIPFISIEELFYQDGEVCYAKWIGSL